MSQINVGGVVKGGLAAGVVMTISQFVLNVPVAGDQMNAEFAARNLPPVSNNQIGVFVVLTFALALLMVWLYAAIRPRLGPGPKTAIIAGLVVWACSYLNISITLAVIGFSSMSLAILTIVWSLVEMLLAAAVGGYLYKEAAPATSTGTGRQPIRRPT